MILRIFFLAILCVPSLLPAEALSLKLVRQEGITNDLAQHILAEAYRRAGISISVQTVPAGRALEEVIQNRADGDVARIDGLEERFPHLIKVPVALLQTKGYAFSLSSLGPLTEWSDLSKFRLAFRRGLQFAEIGTQGFKVERTTTEEQAFRMLEMNRVDVVISGYLDGLETSKILRRGTVQASALPMEKISLYHYLHKKHEDLIPRISRIIQRMESDGELQRLNKEFLSTREIE